MKVVVIGWYGTETIGDRAILDGIIRVFKCIDQNVKIEIGSLWTFFTERTLYEDYGNQHENIKCFDVKNKKILRKKISECEYIVFGGGPIMDGIAHLELMAEIFAYGKMRKKKTIIMGCGLGSLENAEYIRYAKQLFENSDKVFLRDKNSCCLYEKLSGNAAHYIEDPAIISVIHYKSNHQKFKKNDNLVCCFRNYTFSNKQKEEDFKRYIEALLSRWSPNFEKIVLWPMHTFTVGGDDRAYAIELVDKVDYEVEIRSTPPSLWETYDVILKAKSCIGMRHHSVVFQTILNGNNFIIDYTDENIGKIVSFLQNYGIEKLYSNRYININNIESLNNLNISIEMMEERKDVLELDENEIINKYVEKIKNL